jgi:hypothetical protein
MAVTKLLLALCVFPALAVAQFSPGALSKAHAKLDGPILTPLDATPFTRVIPLAALRAVF